MHLYKSATAILSLIVTHAVADAWMDQVVAAHNTSRAQYGAAPVTWNATLYASTVAYAGNCVFAHSTQTPAGQYGENLYAGTASTTGINDAMSSWMGEVVNYNYSSPGFSSATGHFTQVVWKATKQVTCALAACPKGTIFADYASRYIVCRYLPPGNYIGQFAQNVGLPVTSSAVVSTSRPVTSSTAVSTSRPVTSSTVVSTSRPVSTRKVVSTRRK